MKTIYISGIVVAIIPFLGIPSSWKSVLLVALGTIIFVKGYSYYKKDKGSELSFEQNDKSFEKINDEQ